MINNIKSHLLFAKDKISLYGNFLGSNSNIYKDDANKIILTQNINCGSSIIGLTRFNLAHNISINKKNIIFHKFRAKKNISINYFPAKVTEKLNYNNEKNYLFDSSCFQHSNQYYPSNFTLYYNFTTKILFLKF